MVFPILVLLISIFTGAATGQTLNPIIDSILMRDSEKLAADIYLPDASPGKTYPVILVQTPYNRIFYRYTGLPLIGFGLEASAFAFVVLDWRCFYGSAGACTSNFDRGEDGFDAVEWIANQEWCNGKVGTWGSSALGRVQYMTARENPPHLLCVAPLVAAPQYNYLEYFPGGDIRLEYVEQLDALGFGLSPVLYDHIVYDAFWSLSELATFYPASIQIPMFMIGGWYDHNIDVMFDFFAGLQSESPYEGHKMLIGPWAHGSVGKDLQGQLSFPSAAGWSDSLCLRFFGHFLLDETNGWNSEPNIHYFQGTQLGWQSTDLWPPENIFDQYFYLDNDNLLNPTPAQNNFTSSFTFHPKDPSPTIGGSTLRIDLEQGPYDQAPEVESRDDIKIFSSQILDEAIYVAGKPSIRLFVSSNRKDTDFAIRLTDVFPDGRSMLVTDAIKRMRFRDGFYAEDTAMMQPGAIYEINIDLQNLAYCFVAGHKIRLDITSSNFPRFDINLNNGGQMYLAGDTLAADNILIYGADKTAFLRLPIYDHQSGLNNKTSTNNFELFPNPCKNILKIKPGKVNIDKIKIFNGNGNKILEEKPGTYSGVYSINTKDLSPGIYLLEATWKGGNSALKFIKN
jgi:uncharacterized protein